ncbi:MAG TPA: RNA-binding cell elongation regulator Jag/EloR [Actinomycetota bacterium]|nr:RNA-binding cell elongation regulator Jag/EloR [Actinomycetota bacterium]
MSELQDPQVIEDQLEENAAPLDESNDLDQPEEEPSEGGGSEAEPLEALEPPDPQEVAEVGGEFVSGLLATMGLEAEVTTTVEGDSAFIDVKGENLGMLIGRRGQTLDALQELTRTATQRRLKSRVRLLIDVEGYRARRRASLADYAKAIAERAKERGTEIELEPMTAYERKVVHDAVAEIDGASSFSEGEEPNRKVVVRGGE